MHAARRMVVAKLAGDALLGRLQRQFHARLGPGERLDPPFLAQRPVMVERDFVAVEHYDVVQPEIAGLEQPFVGPEQLFAGHVALGDLQHVVDDVGAKDMLHHHFFARFRLEMRKLPEPAVQHRESRHRMVAGGDGHDHALLSAPEIFLGDDQHRRAHGEMVVDAVFENESVVAEVERLERALAAHGDGGHRIGATLAGFPDPGDKSAITTHDDAPRNRNGRHGDDGGDAPPGRSAFPPRPRGRRVRFRPPPPRD